MEGVVRIISSLPLATLAPKTASGGKMRACRFAPGKAYAKPLYRPGKTRRCGQTRVGARILGNTIGNAIAGGIAQDNAPASQGQQPGTTPAPGVVSDVDPSSLKNANLMIYSDGNGGWVDASGNSVNSDGSPAAIVVNGIKSSPAISNFSFTINPAKFSNQRTSSPGKTCFIGGAGNVDNAPYKTGFYNAFLKSGVSDITLVSQQSTSFTSFGALDFLGDAAIIPFVNPFIPLTHVERTGIS